MSDALMRRWFNEVWTKHNEAAIDEMVASDCTIHGLTDIGGRPVPAREAFKQFHQNFRGLFSTLSITVQSSVENE